MKKRVKSISSRFTAEQAGQALVLILVFFLLGSLIILPTLAHMSTALKTGVAYENKTNELFTADAGIENGLWRIKYDSLGPDYDIYDYHTVWTYPPTPSITARRRSPSRISGFPPTSRWIASVLRRPRLRPWSTAEKLVVTGTSGAIPGQPYHIKIEFTPATGDNLTIKSLGIWLPQGFTYTTHSSTLEQGGPFTDYYPDATTVSTVPGGQAVVWSYNPPYPPLTSFPNFVADNGTQTVHHYLHLFPSGRQPQRAPRGYRLDDL